MLAATVPVFVGFVRHELRVVRRGGTPLLALHLLRVWTVTLGLVVSIVFFGGVGVFFVVLTVFFQEGFGYSAFTAGLMFLPFAIGFTGASAVSGAIAARIGPRILNLGTLLMMMGLVGTIALARPGATALDERMLVLLFLVYGLGQGLVQPSLINTVVGSSGVSGEDAGSAAGLFLTTAQSSIALGVAAIGGVFFSRLGAAPDTSSYLDALSTALACNLALLAISFVLVLLLPRAARRLNRS
jgi:predicted MFS family arabinose efflux permease